MQEVDKAIASLVAQLADMELGEVRAEKILKRIELLKSMAG